MERVVQRYAHLAEQLVIQQPPGIPVAGTVAWPQVAVLQAARHPPTRVSAPPERRAPVRPHSRGRQVCERSLAGDREVDSADGGPQSGQIPRGAAGDVLGRKQHLLCGASPGGDAGRSEVGPYKLPQTYALTCTWITAPRADRVQARERPGPGARSAPHGCTEARWTASSVRSAGSCRSTADAHRSHDERVDPRSTRGRRPDVATAHRRLVGR